MKTSPEERATSFFKRAFSQGSPIIKRDAIFEELTELITKADAFDWIEENSTYTGGGHGGKYVFEVTHDSELMIDAIQNTMK